MPKGFASLSRERLKKVSGKGGTVSQLKGTGHAFNAVSASAAGKKSAAKRKLFAMKNAALKLIECGFTAAQLASLNLSADEYIYYGGDKASGRRLRELAGRVKDASKTADGVQSTAE